MTDQIYLSSREEDLPMTLQVGIIGSDGLLLVGDTRQWQQPHGTWYGYKTSKIEIDDTSRIAVACARSMDVSRKIANKVFATFRVDDSQDRRRTIMEIGISVATGSEQDTECLIAFAEPTPPALFRFTYLSRAGISQCDQVFDCIPAGDTGNGAFFWAMRYYRPFLPVNQLIRLGAHIVVAAGKLNSGVIAGLEVVTCDSSGFHRSSIQDNDSLESEIMIEAERIGDIVLAPRA